MVRESSAAGAQTGTARRSPRQPADNRVLITVERLEEQTIRGRCSNLSESGFGAVLAGEVEPGEVVTASLTLQGLDEALVVRAQVRNRQGFTHGLKFIDLKAAQRRVLLRCLKTTALPEQAPAPTAEDSGEAKAEDDGQ